MKRISVNDLSSGWRTKQQSGMMINFTELREILNLVILVLKKKQKRRGRLQNNSL